jgi:lipopolysaccharide export LptBFGC system permease protein LptF
MKIFQLWERKIFLEAVCFMFFFLTCAFILFTIIDFSINGFYFSTVMEFTLYAFLNYYLHQFLKYLDIFISLAMLLTTIKILVGMNKHHETIALYMAGISKRRLSRPFFIIGIMLSVISCLNAEFFSPKAIESILNFKETIANNSKNQEKFINIKMLSNNTKLIYLQEKNKVLFDVFWIISTKNIWHIKYLEINNYPPVGNFVDHFIRNDEGKMEKQESFSKCIFHHMIFLPDTTDDNIETLSLSALFKKWHFKQFPSRQKKIDILSLLNYKIAIAMTPILVPLAITPFCLRFSRRNSMFFITAIAIFVFILFFTLMDSALILAENQILSPFIIIWLIITSFYSFFTKTFLKITK